jgi:hypothetical protein
VTLQGTVMLAPDDSPWITTANGGDTDRVIRLRFVAAWPLRMHR